MARFPSAKSVEAIPVSAVDTKNNDETYTHTHKAACRFPSRTTGFRVRASQQVQIGWPHNKIGRWFLLSQGSFFRRTQQTSRSMPLTPASLTFVRRSPNARPGYSRPCLIDRASAATWFASPFFRRSLAYEAFNCITGSSLTQPDSFLTQSPHHLRKK